MFPAIHWKTYGLTPDQIRAVGLDEKQEYQFDGWMALYRLEQFKSDIQKIAKFD